MTTRQLAWVGLMAGVFWILLNGLMLMGVQLPGKLGSIGNYYLGPVVLMINLRVYWISGTSKHVPLGRLLWIPALLFPAGVLFKLMHWPYATQIMFLGLASVLVIYPVLFFKKPQKRLGDILRLLVVVITVPMIGLRLLHYIHQEYYAWSVVGIMTITTLEFLLSSSEEPKKAVREKVAAASEADSVDMSHKHPELFQ